MTNDWWRARVVLDSITRGMRTHGHKKRTGTKGQTHLVGWAALIERRIDGKRSLNATNRRLTWVAGRISRPFLLVRHYVVVLYMRF